LPTTLPHRRRADEKHSPARIVFEFLFNAAMVVSALILTFMVLVREEQYAFGRLENTVQAIERTAHPSAMDMTGEIQVIPPSN
jgi:hypothetical protein